MKVIKTSLARNFRIMIDKLQVSGIYTSGISVRIHIWKLLNY